MKQQNKTKFKKIKKGIAITFCYILLGIFLFAILFNAFNPIIIHAVNEPILSADEPIDDTVPVDLTGSTWEFNDSILATVGYEEYNIVFYVEALNQDIYFNSIATSNPHVDFNDDIELAYDQTVVYTNVTWIFPYYRTITITGGNDVTNPSLYEFLLTNASLVGVPEYDCRGVWYFNPTLNNPVDIGSYTFDVHFTLYDIYTQSIIDPRCDQFIYSYNVNSGALLTYHVSEDYGFNDYTPEDYFVPVFKNGEWVQQSYRVILIDGGEYTDSILYQFLTKYAIKIDDDYITGDGMDYEWGADFHFESYDYGHLDNQGFQFSFTLTSRDNLPSPHLSTFTVDSSQFSYEGTRHFYSLGRLTNYQYNSSLPIYDPITDLYYYEITITTNGTIPQITVLNRYTGEDVEQVYSFDSDDMIFVKNGSIVTIDFEDYDYTDGNRPAKTISKRFYCQKFDISDAYQSGYDVGYNNGYQNGEAHGYNVGFEDGFQNNLYRSAFMAPVAMMDSVIIFQTQSGVTVTLWGVISAGIGVTLFIWFLKMFAGG